MNFFNDIWYTTTIVNDSTYEKFSITNQYEVLQNIKSSKEEVEQLRNLKDYIEISNHEVFILLFEGFSINNIFDRVR